MAAYVAHWSRNECLEKNAVVYVVYAHLVGSTLAIIRVDKDGRDVPLPRQCYCTSRMLLRFLYSDAHSDFKYLRYQFHP